VRAPVWSEANHLDVLWLRLQPDSDLGFLSDRLSVNETLLTPPALSQVERHGAAKRASARVERNTVGPVYLTEASRAVAIAGFVGGTSVDTQDLRLGCDSFGLNFAAVTAVTLDSRAIPASSRVLITLAARAENQGVIWNKERTSIGESWGHGPTIAERVPATVRLRTKDNRRVFALAPNGHRAAEISAGWKDGWLTFSTRTGPATLHYEVLSR
jgi:hypothetical protein